MFLGYSIHLWTLQRTGRACLKAKQTVSQAEDLVHSLFSNPNIAEALGKAGPVRTSSGGPVFLGN